jgi:hypothetical protein
VGRVTWDAWPTGVSVTEGQHRGGLYPSSTNEFSTSVGLHAIYRFLGTVTLRVCPTWSD